MCTVSWRRAGADFEVFFNRDEQRTRPPAREPRVHADAPIPYVAPIDPVADGTWLAANAAGLVVGILNYYDGQRAPPPPNPCSRGRLVLDQMAQRDAGAVRAAMQAADLSRYPAFVLLALDRAAGVVLHWDGRALRAEAAGERHRPLSTSSVDTDEVLRERRARYAALAGAGEPSAEALLAFHRDTIPRGGAYSVWMERADAWTVSFSRVVVGADAVRYAYQSRGAAEPIVVSLPLSS
ncbi:MAG TPA: NRDE family protein [Kiritimatiellia bacterium]|nr:NRDE family protein [Kiritimatiellia bacterium]